MRIVKSIFFVTLFFLLFDKISCATFGNDLNIQANQLLSDAQNEIKNDAVMLNGFNFQDETISCSMESYYPVSGFVNFNGGRIYLDKDLNFDYGFVMGSCGKIYGNNYSLKFPSSRSIVEIPNLIDKGGRFSLVDELYLGSYIYCVDWSFDDKYLSQVGSSSASDELRLFYFDGSSITLTGGAEIGTSTYVCRWHPSEYYVAVGAASNSGDELRIYKFEPATGALTLVDGVEFGTYCLGISWTPDGKYLAVGTYDSNLRVYSFNSGSLTLIDTISFSGQGYPYIDCVDWKSSGDYIVVGTSSAGDDLLVFSFDGSTLALDVSINIGFISGVSWKRDSSLIAACLFGTKQNLRIYEHAQGSLTAKVLLDDKDSFYSVDWDDNGSRIIAGKAAVKKSPELNLYFINEKSDNLSWITGQERGSNIYACRFSHDGNYILVGDFNRNIFVEKLDQNSMLCDHVEISFNSDAELTTTITFNGKCCVSGNGKKLIFRTDCQLNISPGAEVHFKNFEIIGLNNLNLTCLDDDASIYFKDCKIILDNNFEFKKGSLFFENNNEIYGTGKFIFSSSEKITICSGSTLHLSSGITFSYDPGIADKNLIIFEDSSSCLYLNGSTLHATLTGMQLKKGKLKVKNTNYFSCEKNDSVDEGISIGNDLNEDDFEIKILGGSAIELINGSLKYRNINSPSWCMENNFSFLHISSNCNLYLYQNIDLGVGIIKYNNNGGLFAVPGKKITGSFNVSGYINYQDLE